VAQGLLPDTAIWPEDNERPWPVTLITGFGAWLAFWPLCGLVALLFGQAVYDNAGIYVLGLFVLGGALVVLRQTDVGLFIEQMAVPALMVGAGCIVFGLVRDLDNAKTLPVMLLALVLTIALLVRRPWLEMLLGAFCCGIVALLLSPAYWYPRWNGIGQFALWLPVHLVLGAWAAGCLLQLTLPPRAAALLETMGAGWLAVVLVMLAWISGSTFLVGGALGGFGLGAGTGLEDTSALALTKPVVSAGLVALAAVVGSKAWPALRQPWLAGPWALAMGLAWFLPTLGGVILALAIAVTTHRWRLASLAGLAAVWIIGSFYYLLAWPLATKAVVLVGGGVGLAGLAWFTHRQRSRVAAGLPPASPAWGTLGARGRAALGILLTAGLTLAVANGAIWQKEQLIAQGQKVYVPLMPVDPTSLMQGDYMALRFITPWALTGMGYPQSYRGERPFVVATRDARGVVSLLRVQDDAEALAPGEFRIQLTRKGGDWVLVTDAWFFKQGDAARFELAKFGEFRVMPDGRALLVGMADAELRPIEP